ncbi:MAG: porin family protein [Sphingobacteriales bacterium]
MTKRFFLFIVIICATTLANAQNVRYLLRGGLNATNGTFTTGNYKASSSYLPGGYVGVQLKVFFDPPVYFAPQFNLLHKAAEFKVNDKSDTTKIRLELNQFQIAPFLQYDFHRPGEAGVFINGSLSLYTTINGKETITRSNNTTTKRDMKFSKSAYGRFEAGAHLGFGYETKKWVGQLMYNRGLSNMFNGDNSDDYSGPKIKFHTITLGIGWYLN